MKKSAILVFGSIAFFSVIGSPVMAVEGGISKEQTETISSQCSIIKDNLKNLQHEDSKARVHLGSYYEKILVDYMTPFNVALIAKGITNVNLVENQSNFSESRAKFAGDYITYQKSLEELVAINCKKDPVKFYEKLISVRAERKKVADDIKKLRSLITTQVSLVTALKESL